jgi:S1-C subfamily serine protease
MNARLSLCLGMLALLTGRAALGQPALDRVEQQLRRQAQPRAADEADATVPQPGGAAAGKPSAGQTAAGQPGYLGVVADDRQDRGRGARLLEIVADGPAAKAGLKIGDLITSVNDQPVRELDDMTRLLELRPAGAVVMMQVTRDGADRQVPVTLGARPPADKRRLPQFGKQPETLPEPASPPASVLPAVDSLVMVPGGPKLGVRTLPIDAAAQRQFNLPTTIGALVSFVNAGSPAEKAGVPLGAAIVAVDSQPIDRPETLAALIRQLTVGQTVDLTCIVRGQEQHKRVVLAAASTGPQPQVRGKPASPPVAGVQPPGFMPELGPTDESVRIQALERRMAELEGRIEKLEAAK